MMGEKAELAKRQRDYWYAEYREITAVAEDLVAREARALNERNDMRIWRNRERESRITANVMLTEPRSQAAKLADELNRVRGDSDFAFRLQLTTARTARDKWRAMYVRAQDELAKLKADGVASKAARQPCSVCGDSTCSEWQP
jgi:hypothetical protein